MAALRTCLPDPLLAGRILNWRHQLLCSDFLSLRPCQGRILLRCFQRLLMADFQRQVHFSKAQDSSEGHRGLEDSCWPCQNFLRAVLQSEIFLLSFVGLTLGWRISQLPPTPRLPSPAFAPINLWNVSNSILASAFQMTWTNPIGTKNDPRKDFNLGPTHQSPRGHSGC